MAGSDPTDPTKICMKDEWYNKHCDVQLAAMRHALDFLPSFGQSKRLEKLPYQEQG